MPRGPSYVGCQVDDCDGKHYAKKYCHKHYGRVMTTGSTELKKKEATYCECGREATAGRGMCKRCYQSWWQANRNGKSTGTKWYKAEVGYNGAHSRIRAVRGHAHNFPCVLCGEQATDWALSADAGDVRYGKIHPNRETTTAYSLDVYSYLPMCSDCHRRYDAETGNRAYKTGKYARARR